MTGTNLRENENLANREAYIHVPYIFALIFYVFIMRGEYIKEETYIVFIATMFLHISIFLYPKEDCPVTRIGGFVVALLFYLFSGALLHKGIITAFAVFLDTLCLFTGVFVYKFYKLPSVGNSRSFAFCISAVWIYYCVKASLYYNSHPGVAREIISSAKDSWGNLAIGSPYALAYGSCLIAVYLFGILLSKQLCISKKNRFIIIAALIVLLYTIYLTESAITLICTAVGMGICIWERLLRTAPERGIGIQIGVIILTITAGVVLLLNRSEIGLWIIKSTNGHSDSISIRLTEIGNFLYAGGVSRTMGGRMNLLYRSIEGFLKSPLLGVQYNPKLEGYIGNHSELFDALGRYGLIGSILYYAPFFLTIKEERRQFGGYISYGYIVSLILMFTFNPFHSKQSNFALFFILPMLGGISVSSSKQEGAYADLVTREPQ